MGGQITASRRAPVVLSAGESHQAVTCGGVSARLSSGVQSTSPHVTQRHRIGDLRRWKEFKFLQTVRLSGRKDTFDLQLVVFPFAHRFIKPESASVKSFGEDASSKHRHPSRASPSGRAEPSRAEPVGPSGAKLSPSGRRRQVGLQVAKISMQITK